MINSGDRPSHLLYTLISYLLCNFLVHVWTTNLIRVTCLYVCFCNIWVNGRSKWLLSYFTGFIRGGFFCAAVLACFSLGHGVFEPFSFLSFCDSIMTLFCFFCIRTIVTVRVHPSHEEEETEAGRGSAAPSRQITTDTITSRRSL